MNKLYTTTYGEFDIKRKNNQVTTEPANNPHRIELSLTPVSRPDRPSFQDFVEAYKETLEQSAKHQALEQLRDLENEVDFFYKKVKKVLDKCYKICDNVYTNDEGLTKTKGNSL